MSPYEFQNVLQGLLWKFYRIYFTWKAFPLCELAQAYSIAFGGVFPKITEATFEWWKQHKIRIYPTKVITWHQNVLKW